MYRIYITAHDGDGISQVLKDWDGEESLELRLAAFANDALITIEPLIEERG